MTATIRQIVQAATTVATPASVAVTLASTLVGSLLVAFVNQESTAPGGGASATNWDGTSNGVSNAAVTGLIYKNNPGGLTSVTFNLLNANSACATVYEIVGGQTVSSLMSPVASCNTSTASVSFTQSAQDYGEMWVFGFGYDTASTFSSGPSGLFSQAGTTQTSTLGAVNLAQRCYFVQVTGSNYINLQNITVALTVSAATHMSMMFFRVATVDTQPVAVGAYGAFNVSGNIGGIGGN